MKKLLTLFTIIFLLNSCSKEEVNTYHLDVIMMGGMNCVNSTTIISGSTTCCGDYTEGSVVSILVSCGNYRFSHWESSNNSINGSIVNPQYVTMNQDIELIAVFE